MFSQVFLAILIGLTVFCWFRRRAKRRRGEATKPTDEYNADQDKEPHIGYRATILGLPKRVRKKSADYSRPDKPDRRGSEEEWQATPISELPVEPTLRSGDLSEKETTQRSVFVVSPRTNDWLKGTPNFSTPELPGTPTGTHETRNPTPTLADIHERLTKTDHETQEASPPALFNEESRWSGTTRSSVFTEFSSRSSGAAYYSNLRPPPLSKETRMDALPEFTHTIPSGTPMHRPQTMGGEHE